MKSYHVRRFCKSFSEEGNPSGCQLPYRGTEKGAALIGNNGRQNHPFCRYYHPTNFVPDPEMLFLPAKKIKASATWLSTRISHGHHTISMRS